eukprot:COSAG02_NODE_1349_length_13132_cov_8.583289_5_plen_146_part_00
MTQNSSRNHRIGPVGTLELALRGPESAIHESTGGAGLDSCGVDPEVTEKCSRLRGPPRERDTRHCFVIASHTSIDITSTCTVHLLEMQGWMRKVFSEPADPYINRSVSRSAFHCTFYFLQQSSFRLFIARSLLSPVPVNPTQALK